MPILIVSLLLLVACTKKESVLLIQNKGSDTLVNLARAWAEEYKKVHPSVAIAVSGGGSGTGLAALINGTVDIANSSRAMKDEEKEEPKGIMENDQRIHRWNGCFSGVRPSF